MNEKFWVGKSCPIILNITNTSNSFWSGRGSTFTCKLSTLGSKFSIVVIISLSITDAVPKSTNPKRLSRTYEPKMELKNLSVGIVCTKLRTDLLIAFSLRKTVMSLVTGCGLKDKFMSLNALDVRFTAIYSIFLLFIPILRSLSLYSHQYQNIQAPKMLLIVDFSLHK